MRCQCAISWLDICILFLNLAYLVSLSYAARQSEQFRQGFRWETSNRRQHDINRLKFWTSSEKSIQYHKHSGFSCLVRRFTGCLEVPQIIQTVHQIWEV